MQISEIIFWASAAVLGWAYFGYPLAVIVLGYLTPRHRPKLRGEYLPNLLVILPFHNRQEMVKSSHDAVLAVDYPKDRLQILLVDNGSRDGTRRRAIETAAARFNTRALLFGGPAPRGRIIKEAAQNHPDAEVLVMIEPGMILEPGVLRALTQAFRDPGAGVVGGRALFHPRLAAAREWWWHGAETFIHRIEARFETAIGCCPMLYAMRREIAEIIDPRAEADTLAATFAACARGKVVRIEPAARGFITKSDISSEFHRLIDACAGAVLAILRKPSLLVPVLNPLWWQFTSHTFVRFFSPVLLMGLLVSSIILADQSPFMLAACVAQLCFHFLGLACTAFPAIAVFPLRLASDIYRLNVATVLGMWKALIRFAKKHDPAALRPKLA